MRFFNWTGKLLTALLLSLYVTQQASAELTVITGSTVGAPQYHRTLVDFSGWSGAGTSVPYTTHTFDSGAGGSYGFLATGEDFDIVLFLYRGAFDPADPFANGVAGSDDLWNVYNAGFVRSLDPGMLYTLVVTSFADGMAGDYTLKFGPGSAIPGQPIPGVPEPSAWLMLGLGAGALALARRRPRRG